VYAALMSAFTPHPNFDASSYRPYCAVTRLPLQKAGLGVQDHEIDHFILRGPEITLDDGRGERSLGFVDVRPVVIREAAEKHLGMVSRDVHARTRTKLRETEALLDDARTLAEGFRDQVRGLVLGNAELITEIAGLQEALEQAYAELYPEGEDLGGDVYDLSDDELLSIEALAAAEEEL